MGKQKDGTEAAAGFGCINRRAFLFASGATVGGTLDPHKAGVGTVTEATSAHFQLAVPDYRSQYVVEIMRNAAGELSHGLRLLGLKRLPLEYLPCFVQGGHRLL